MYKILSVVAALVVGYVVFFQSPAPESIVFDGNEFADRELERTNDSNSEVYSYHSQSASNADSISILFPDSGTGAPGTWADMLESTFERQGFQFSDSGLNKVGINGNVKVFMMPDYERNVVILYLLTDINNADHFNESNVFENLEAVALK